MAAAALSGGLYVSELIPRMRCAASARIRTLPTLRRVIPMFRKKLHSDHSPTSYKVSDIERLAHIGKLDALVKAGAIENRPKVRNGT